MSSVVGRLIKKNLITPPSHLKDGICYEVMMGSVAYGCSNDTSDVDVYGFCIPNRSIIFPHESGYIHGLDKDIPNFEQFQQHHVKDGDKEYDFSIYSIIKYFRLATKCVPNMIDSLFVPRRCVLYTNIIGEMVREKRKMFLHKGAWHKFKGYAYSQLHKMKIKKPNPNSKRYDSIQKYGYDIKFAYHIVRLLQEVEQILMEGDLDLQKNREQLKSIRRGEWTIEDIENYFTTKEKDLESAYLTSKLQYKANIEDIKALLVNCLEEYYGSLSKTFNTVSVERKVLDDIKLLLQKV